MTPRKKFFVAVTRRDTRRARALTRSIGCECKLFELIDRTDSEEPRFRCVQCERTWRETSVEWMPLESKPEYVELTELRGIEVETFLSQAR